MGNRAGDFSPEEPTCLRGLSLANGATVQSVMAPTFLACSLLLILLATPHAHALPGSSSSSSWASHQDAISRSSSAEKNHIVAGVKQPRAHVPKYMLELYESMKTAQTKSHIADVVRSYNSVNGVNVFTRSDNDINGRERQLGSQTRIHTLLFNVSSLPQHERLEKAELRLYALIRRDQHTYSGVERQVILSTCETTHQGGSECEAVETRHIHETASTWETFVVTEAVQDWLEKGKSKRKEQRLEIQITSIFSTDSGDLDFPTEPHSDTEPLLLVYSSDRRRPPPEEEDDDTDDDDNDVDDDDDNDIADDDNETLNDLHALRRRSADIEEAEEESNSVFDPDPMPRAPSGRINRKRHKNPCRRRSLYVNFADINYDTWIIAPTGYEAYECTGKCYFPLSDHLSPSKHAIVQTLLHTVSPKKTARACCVPTRLSPISVLYVDDEGVVTYKFHYDDMVVAECGCR